MKKIYFLLVFVAFYSDLTSQFRIGIEAGMVISKVQNLDELFPLNYRVGSSISLPVSMDIGKDFGVGLNLAYLQKGLKSSFNIQSTIVDLRCSYLQITPNFNFEIYKSLRLGTGIYYAFKIKESQKFNDEPRQDTSIDFFEKSDVGVVPSVSYDVGRFQVNLRYHHGLQSALNFPTTGASGLEEEVSKSFNRALEISIRYNFIPCKSISS